MDWIQWLLVLVVGLTAGALGAFLYARRSALARTAATWQRELWQRWQTFTGRQTSRLSAPVNPHRQSASEEELVLIPDGRPWPLGPALQLLELAWRWQVVHGTNLPLQARHGEGAYVWRPPLPSHNTQAERPNPEAER